MITLDYRGCSGAHVGLTDWYPDLKEKIEECLAQGENHEWTTDWYSSKKEVASAKITCENKQLKIKVSVSDDFDTEGMGETTIPFTTDLETIREAIYEAWEHAASNQKENQLYVGWSIFGKDESRSSEECCLDYYIQPAPGQEDWLDVPPGDSYHEWGFQDPELVPEEVRNELEKFIFNHHPENGEYKYKGFTVKRWDD